MRTLLLTCCVWLCSTAGVFAAELLVSASNIPRIGEDIVLNVSINTQGERINALEGVLAYQPELMRLREIRDGNSSVTFWVERPRDRDGRIRFAGITPGGFQGNGELFTLIFESRTETDVRLVLDNARALLHDGEGTETQLVLHETVLRMADAEEKLALAEIEDRTPPESFVAHVDRSDALFDGAYFVAFATQDKGSGIERFDVAESRYWVPKVLQGFLRWRHAESPHLLADQNRMSYVYIRAIDRSGNGRVEFVSPQSGVGPYGFIAMASILLLLAGIIALIYVRRRS